MSPLVYYSIRSGLKKLWALNTEVVIKHILQSLKSSIQHYVFVHAIIVHPVQWCFLMIMHYRPAIINSHSLTHSLTQLIKFFFTISTM